MGKIAMWVLSIFAVILAVAAFPSISTILLAAFVAIAIPIEAVQDFWFFHDIDGWKKGVLLAALFLVSLAIVPKTPAEKTEDHTTEFEQQNKNADESEKSDESSDNKAGENDISISSIDITDYLKLDAEVLFEYGKYFGNQNVVTVITVSDAGSNTLKAKTDNNDSLFFSIVCNFKDEDIGEGIEEGELLTIAGTIKEYDLFGEKSIFDTPTITLENCAIIGFGEISEEVQSSTAEQREIGEQRKSAYEAEVEARMKAEKEDYIAQCQTVNYSDVERNPDNYEGVKIKISGKIVQVSEGWFNTVTLRINCGGNMWYATYSREEGESRILEGDSITAYGECNGVKSYTTVLGAQVTIPSIKIEYYS